MARKDGSTLREPQKGSHGRTALLLPDVQVARTTIARARDDSWACVGMDASMSSLAFCSMIWDSTLKKMRGPFHFTKRWIEEDYFIRLRDAAYAHEYLLAVVPGSLVTIAKVYVAIEEPWYYGAVKQHESAWLKQQAEVAGAAKASLLRWGFQNLHEINNSQWRAAIRRDKVTIPKGEAGKFTIKKWAIDKYGLPDLPDLVKNKQGTKIPRPESGFGAKAKPVQPEDIYDACGMMKWAMDEREKGSL